MTSVKTYCIACLCLISGLSYAQLHKVKTQLKFIKFTIPNDTIQGWHREGVITLNINQSAYKHWQRDANNTVELTAMLNHRFNYKTNKLLWDNYIIAEFGMNKLQGQNLRKTQDRLELNAIVGYELPKHWSASYFINFQTQLANSYDYLYDADKDFRINGFLAPLYVTTGPGFMWKKNEHLNFNIAPITVKFTYIIGSIYAYNKGENSFNSNDEKTLLGIEAGDHYVYQMGFYSSGLYQFKLTNNIQVENRLALYANYLNDFSNMDIDYTMRMNLEVNKRINTQIIWQLRYDDDAIRRIQLREVLGVGLKFKL